MSLYPDPLEKCFSIYFIVPCFVFFLPPDNASELKTINIGEEN
jgi:hypothetical protein